MSGPATTPLAHYEWAVPASSFRRRLPPTRHPCARPLPPLQLLEAIKPLKRGLAASEEDKARVERLAKDLERRNPTKKPLASDLVNGESNGACSGGARCWRCLCSWGAAAGVLVVGAGVLVVVLVPDRTATLPSASVLPTHTCACVTDLPACLCRPVGAAVHHL